MKRALPSAAAAPAEGLTTAASDGPNEPSVHEDVVIARRDDGADVAVGAAVLPATGPVVLSLYAQIPATPRPDGMHGLRCEGERAPRTGLVPQRRRRGVRVPPTCGRCKETRAIGDQPAGRRAPARHTARRQGSLLPVRAGPSPQRRTTDTSAHSRKHAPRRRHHTLASVT
jgi:hypothetical protein